jgi:hypothetical protein
MSVFEDMGPGERVGMRTRAMKSMLEYGDRTPVQWLRTAAASIEESLAALCFEQWSYARAAVADHAELKRRR